MKKPHKHAELIKAWADGAEIQVCTRGFWLTNTSPRWLEEKEYRIKPEPKPDLVLYSLVGNVIEDKPCSPYANITNAYWQLPEGCDANLKLIWDGETGVLKSAEVLC